MKMDKVLINGNIYTMEGKKEDAVGILKNRIVKVGTNRELKKHIRNNTHVIDLKGDTVLPGFNDSHIHLMGYGNSLNSINLENVTSVKELINKSKDFIENKDVPSGQWVIGRGWNQEKFEDYNDFPDREFLDKISKKHPILLLRICGHIGAVNSKALKNVGVDKSTYIEGGQFDKNSKGELNGVIREAALEWFKKNMNPKPKITDLKKIINDASNELLKYGVTSVHTEDSYDLGYSGNFIDIYKAYNFLAGNGNLKTRIYQKISLPNMEDLNSFLENDLRTGMGDEFYKIGPMKLWLDGTLGAATAALKEDYNDDPGNKGVMVYNDDELYNLVYKAHNNNMQVCLHTIGDAALEQALNIYENVINNGQNSLRHRIVHCQIGNESLYKKIADLNIVVNIQPVFVASDWSIVNKRLGLSRMRESYPWRKLLDLNINVSASSDCPVESPNPFYGIYSAVTRKDLNGNPEGGFLPEQKLSVWEAIKLYTSGSAFASFDEDKKGTISEGKLADMIVLSQDPLKIKQKDLKDIEIKMTVFDGKIYD